MLISSLINVLIEKEKAMNDSISTTMLKNVNVFYIIANDTVYNY